MKSNSAGDGPSFFSSLPRSTAEFTASPLFSLWIPRGRVPFPDIAFGGRLFGIPGDLG